MPLEHHYNKWVIRQDDLDLLHTSKLSDQEKRWAVYEQKSLAIVMILEVETFIWLVENSNSSPIINL